MLGNRLEHVQKPIHLGGPSLQHQGGGDPRYSFVADGCRQSVCLAHMAEPGRCSGRSGSEPFEPPDPRGIRKFGRERPIADQNGFEFGEGSEKLVTFDAMNSAGEVASSRAPSQVEWAGAESRAAVRTGIDQRTAVAHADW